MTTDSDQQDSLLDAVYDLALNPDTIDDFTMAWERFLQNHDLSPDDTRELQETLEKHFERSFQLLEKIGRSSKTDPGSLQQFVDDRRSPSVALNNKGKVLAINAEALELFGADTDMPNVLEMVHKDSRSSLQSGLQQLSNTSTPEPILVLLRNRLPALLLMQPMSGTDLIIADISGSSWDQRVSTVLSAMYGLTARECDVAALLYRGLTIKQIAVEQHRSLETVRKHTKSILAKTETRSQPKLMRLLTSLNFAHAGDQSQPWMNSQCDNHTIRLHDGRTLAYYDAGKKNGKPIVVLHGIVHDPELPPKIHQQLINQGYRIIGMSRAWFGESSPPINRKNVLQSAAADLSALLDSLEIKRVSLLACMAGSIHAYTFASTYPEKVRRIINLGGMVPITGDDQINSMPLAMRAVARTARYFPKLFPTLIRSGVALIDGGSIRKILSTGYRSSPVDFEATHDPEIFKRLSIGYRFAVHNGYSAYSYEGIAIMQDCSSTVDAVQCPIDYINGTQDGITSIESVSAFCDKYANANLHQVVEGGHLLIYTQPSLVAQQLQKLLS